MTAQTAKTVETPEQIAAKDAAAKVAAKAELDAARLAVKTARDAAKAIAAKVKNGSPTRTRTPSAYTKRLELQVWAHRDVTTNMPDLATSFTEWATENKLIANAAQAIVRKGADKGKVADGVLHVHIDTAESFAAKSSAKVPSAERVAYNNVVADARVAAAAAAEGITPAQFVAKRMAALLEGLPVS